MKQTIRQAFGSAAVVGILALAALTSCGKGSNTYNFKTAQEAVDACKKELSVVKRQKDTSIETVGKLAGRWIVLQDSCYSVFLRDSTFDYNGEIAGDFVSISDSIRDGIIDIAVSRPRTLQEIVKLKVATAHNRASLISSKDYKDVEKFYSDLNNKKIIKGKEKTLAEYNRVLDIGKLSLEEKELRTFLAEEDICFRSVMAVLPSITDNELQDITDKTTQIFNSLDGKAMEENPDGTMSRTMIYLTMRFNRRIIQNALACQHDIKAGKELTDQTAANYRWMLIQPLMTIDNSSFAALTENDIQQLSDLAGELPMLMAYVDGKDFKSISKENAMKLAQVLSGYFLKSHLKSIL